MGVRAWARGPEPGLFTVQDLCWDVAWAVHRAASVGALQALSELEAAWEDLDAIVSGSGASSLYREALRLFDYPRLDALRLAEALGGPGLALLLESCTRSLLEGGCPEKELLERYSELMGLRLPSESRCDIKAAAVIISFVSSFNMLMNKLSLDEAEY